MSDISRKVVNDKPQRESQGRLNTSIYQMWMLKTGPSQNNLRLEGTFLNVDQLVNGQWIPVKSDSHPSTKYQWLRVSTVRIAFCRNFPDRWVYVKILGTSTVTISWTIESGTPGKIASNVSPRFQFWLITHDFSRNLPPHVLRRLETAYWIHLLLHWPFIQLHRFELIL